MTTPDSEGTPADWALVGVGGALDGVRTVVDRHATVGTAEDCSLRLSGAGVDATHAQLAVVAGHLSVKDLGSGAGTFHNGSQIERALLDVGDTVTFGDQNFLVEGPREDGEAARSNLDRTIISGASASIAKRSAAAPAPEAPRATEPEARSNTGLIIGVVVVLLVLGAALMLA